MARVSEQSLNAADGDAVLVRTLQCSTARGRTQDKKQLVLPLSWWSKNDVSWYGKAPGQTGHAVRAARISPALEHTTDLRDSLLLLLLLLHATRSPPAPLSSASALSGRGALQKSEVGRSETGIAEPLSDTRRLTCVVQPVHGLSGTCANDSQNWDSALRGSAAADTCFSYVD
jgi:hypothetical protein